MRLDIARQRSDRAASKGKIIGWIVAGLVVLAALPLCFGGRPQPRGASADATATVSRGPIERRIEVDGRVSPKNTYSLAFPTPSSDQTVGPNIETITVSPGSQVQAGWMLAQLEGDDVDSARITAPVDGIIVEVRGATGAPPPPGAVIVMRTLDLDADFLLGESDIAALSPGVDATVTIPVLGKELSVKITQLPKDPSGSSGSVASGSSGGSAAQAAQVTQSDQFSVRIDVAELDGLLPGMTARLLVIPQSRADALLIPAAAVGGSPTAPFAEVMVGREAQSRKIKTGITDGRNVEVLDGLNEGETVVLNPEEDQ